MESPFIRSLDAIAEYTTLGRDVVHAALKSGSLRHIRLGEGRGAAWITKIEWIDEYMERLATGGEQDVEEPARSGAQSRTSIKRLA